MSQIEIPQLKPDTVAQIEARWPRLDFENLAFAVTLYSIRTQPGSKSPQAVADELEGLFNAASQLRVLLINRSLEADERLSRATLQTDHQMLHRALPDALQLFKAACGRSLNGLEGIDGRKGRKPRHYLIVALAQALDEAQYPVDARDRGHLAQLTHWVLSDTTGALKDYRHTLERALKNWGTRSPN